MNFKTRDCDCDIDVVRGEETWYGSHQCPNLGWDKPAYVILGLSIAIYLLTHLS